MRLKQLTVPALALALGASVGCTTPEGGAMDYDAAAGIGAANATFMAMMAEGNVDGVVALYTVDGSVMPPGMPVAQGTAAIAEAFGGLLANGGVDMTLETSEIHGDGESVTEVGHYTLGTLDGDFLDEGKYVVVWRHVNGEWKLHRDIWNSSITADDDGDHEDDDD